jgi:hypothetical protein
MTEDRQSKAAEMMKKALTVGVGALFLTEESLKALVSEFKLPKELLKPVLDSAGKTKNEFLRVLSEEVMSRIADKVDPVGFVEEFLNRNEVEFTVKISVKPKAKK